MKGVNSAQKSFNPNRSLGGYALIRFLFVICFTDFRLQWTPIAPSNKQNICPKIETDIIIILMTDLGSKKATEIRLPLIRK